MSNRGFTIIELMIALAIVAITFGYAIPAMQTAIQNNRLTIQANDLIADLNLARSEAIKRGLRVIICRSDTAESTTPACGGAKAWEDGRMTFVDANSNGIYDKGTDDILLRARGQIGVDSMTIRGKGDATMQNQITYTGQGMTSLPSGTHYFTICDDRGPARAKAVLVDRTGRASIVRTDTLAFLCP